MRKKLYLVIALLVALAVTVGTFTYTQTSATTGPTISQAGVSGTGAFATVSTIEPLIFDSTYATTYESPSWSPSVDAAGSITAGDIYYIDVGTYTGDILVTIYLNNPAALLKDYSFLNMAIGAYGAGYDSQASPTWTWNGSPITQFMTGIYYNYYLTLTNGYVSFILKASDTATDGTNSYFAITIEGGSYYCISTTAGDLSPDFYIDIRQA